MRLPPNLDLLGTFVVCFALAALAAGCSSVPKNYAGSLTERLLVGFGAGSPYLMVRGRVSDLTSRKAVMYFIVKRGFEGLDLGFSNESVLRQQIGDMAKDVANIASRVKDHRRLN